MNCSKITMSSYDTTVSWEVDHDDVTTHEMLKGFVSCMIGLTFSKDSVIQAMKDYLEDEE